jgi:hypothetical protein
MAPHIEDTTTERLIPKEEANAGGGFNAGLSAPDSVPALMAIGERCSSLPDLDTRSADDILSYDDLGAFG